MRTRETVVVTGAAGQLGSRIATAFDELGLEVIGIDRAAPAAGQEHLRWVQGDLRSSETLAPAISHADIVIHTAGYPFPTMASPEEIFATNTQSTFAVLEASASASVRRVVVSSSGSILGLRWAPDTHSPHPVSLPVDENYPVAPTDCYALSKMVDEATCAMFARRSGLPIVALRFPGIASLTELRQRAEAIRRDPAIGARTLWAYLELSDASAAFVAAANATTGLAKFEVIGVAAADSLGDLPTMDLIQRFHPETRIVRPIKGQESTWDLSKAWQLLKWKPTRSWRDQLERT